MTPRPPRARPGHLQPASHAAKVVALVLIVAGVVVGVTRVGPMLLGPGFHAYADRRALAGLPNALDVLSNLPFVLVGLLGLRRVARRPSPDLPRWLFGVLFGSIAAIGLGSGLYHVRPTDLTLVWDWLPIAVMFMAFLAIVIADRVHLRAGVGLSAPFCCLGAGSALYWFTGAEVFGSGDMRWYVLVQIAGAVTLGAVLLLFPHGRMRTRDLLLALGLYLAARFFAGHDEAILRATGVVSGHSLKHVVAALGTLAIYQATRTWFEPSAEPVPSGAPVALP